MTLVESFYLYQLKWVFHHQRLLQSASQWVSFDEFFLLALVAVNREWKARPVLIAFSMHELIDSFACISGCSIMLTIAAPAFHKRVSSSINRCDSHSICIVRDCMFKKHFISTFGYSEQSSVMCLRHLCTAQNQSIFPFVRQLRLLF